MVDCFGRRVVGSLTRLPDPVDVAREALARQLARKTSEAARKRREPHAFEGIWRSTGLYVGISALFCLEPRDYAHNVFRTKECVCERSSTRLL